MELYELRTTPETTAERHSKAPKSLTPQDKTKRKNLNQTHSVRFRFLLAGDAEMQGQPDDEIPSSGEDGKDSELPPQKEPIKEPDEEENVHLSEEK